MVKAFISYSWENDEHKKWVKELASRMRRDGIDVTLDQWHLAYGDQLPQFMEKSLRENDFIIIICTPQYKDKSDKRTGGVGYEGDIMSAEVLTSRNLRKFIPVIRNGDIKNAFPTWLNGKLAVDLCGSPYSDDQYSDLIATVKNEREQPPEIGVKAPFAVAFQSNNSSFEKQDDFDIIIQGIVVDEVTVPKMDGSSGSALYSIPFKLNKVPSQEWKRVFVQTWNHPPRYTSMHRPKIARIYGDLIILNGTTIEEVERYHRDTLKICVEYTNKAIEKYENDKRLKQSIEENKTKNHFNNISDKARNISFD